MAEDIGGDWAMIAAQLPGGWRELAVEMGAVRERYPAQLGAKVTDAETLLRVVLHHVAAGTSLRVAAAGASAAGIVQLSAVALHKRMRTVGPYLGALLARMTGAAAAFPAERWAGYEIILVDASSVAAPGSDGTTARMHLALRLADLKPVAIEVTDETGGETFRNFDARPGQLWMGDRGYSNPPGIASVTDQGADVLVRYARGSLPLYDARGLPFDVPRRLAGLPHNGRAREWPVWVRPRGHEPIRGRLCALRLPAHKAAEARERARREQGAAVTRETLAAAEFVVVFTTADRLSADLVLELYRLRWQVELHFKRDKSLTGLDRLPNHRPDTVYSWMVAKLLAQELAWRVASPQVAIPPCAARHTRKAAGTQPARAAARRRAPRR